MCSVARETTEPSTVVGSNSATGVSTPGASHLHGDVTQDGGLLLGWELEGDGPARCLGGKAELGLDGEVIDLHDDAVDVVVEVAAMFQGVLAELVHRGLAVHDADVGVDREARRAQPLQKLMLAFHAKLRGLSDGVDEGGQVALGRDSRILLAQRARRGIAAVGRSSS